MIAAKVRGAHRICGFTLVELLIVVIIVGLLAAIVVPNFGDAVSTARDSSAEASLNIFRSAVANYRLEHDDALPDMVANWDPLTTETWGSDGAWVGPYLLEGAINNPINGLSTVVNGTGDVGSDAGWVFDYDSGNGSGRLWATGADKRSVLDH